MASSNNEWSSPVIHYCYYLNSKLKPAQHTGYTSSPTQRTINLSIELLRGVAAIMVMLCHYAVMIQGTERGWLNFFYTGVDLFFVISGFIFAPTILAPAKENAIAFAIRRIFRIYPLFLAAVFLYALLPDKTWDSSAILQHAFFLHTLVSKEIAFFYNPAFWSLPVEIEFYLLITLLILFKFSNVKQILITLLGLSLLCHILTQIFLAPDSHAKLVLTHHLVIILPEFLLGTLAYQICKNCSSLQSVLFGIAGLTLLYMLGQGFIIYGDKVTDMTYGFFNLLCSLGYQWILIACVVLLHNFRNNTTFILLTSVLGSLSYGIYLFHNAMPSLLIHYFQLDGFNLLVGSIMATFCLSAIMYKILEDPARKYGKQIAQRFYRT